ncbi:MAG: transcription elongation factor GreA [Armatimonadota bacterium]
MDLSESRTVLTRKGYEDIQRELDEIIKVKRPAVTSRIREAKALGDLSENFDYHDAKREQGMMEARVYELKTILNCATIIDCSADDGCVGIGNKVVIKDIEEGFEDEYLIVGPPESNPSEGKISYESSVGKALIGHKVGDKVLVSSPGGEFEYEIISIE